MADEVVVEYAERVVVGVVELAGDLGLPADARGVVVFAHGSGSSRHSPRNRQVAGAFHRAGYATLLLDLLTAEEAEADQGNPPSALRHRHVGRPAQRGGGLVGRPAGTLGRCRWPSSARAPVRRRAWSPRRIARSGYGWSSPAAADPIWPVLR